MASSNRHWPSMFKSKHQWQHDALLPASSCHRSSSSSSAAERAPEPKPRWNPRPEQIRILEAIFNSGMVNPPREEIRRIRAQLQEYGQVGDANVFYWFQNRKSRSKHKLRHLQSQRQQPQRCSNPAAVSVPASSSSSSSERTSSAKPESPKATAVAELYGEPLVAYLSTLMEGGAGQWGELAAGEPCGDLAPGKPEEESAYSTDAAAAGSESIATVVVTTTTTTTTVADSSAITNSMIAGTHQGEDEGGVVGGGGGDVTSMRSLLVFINDVAFEVSADRLDVKAAFGETAVLLHPSGHPVLVDQWGVTLQPLDNGASYYLV